MLTNSRRLKAKRPRYRFGIRGALFVDDRLRLTFTPRPLRLKVWIPEKGIHVQRGFLEARIPEEFPILPIHRRKAARRPRRSAAVGAGLAVAIALVLAGCRTSPSKPASTLTPLQAQGKHVFDVGCAYCHVTNTQRLTPVPPDQRGLFTRKTLPDRGPATDAGVEHVLMTGKGQMPSFEYQMTQQQMAAVIAYLHVYGAAPHQ